MHGRCISLDGTWSSGASLGFFEFLQYDRVWQSAHAVHSMLLYCTVFLNITDFNRLLTRQHAQDGTGQDDGSPSSDVIHLHLSSKQMLLITFRRSACIIYLSLHSRVVR